MLAVDNLFDILDWDKTSMYSIDEINNNLSKYKNSFNILYINIRST